MKKLLFKLFFTPFVAYFAMMLSVAIAGSFFDIRELIAILPGNNAMPIWLGWLGLISIITIAHHFLKKKVEE